MQSHDINPDANTLERVIFHWHKPRSVRVGAVSHPWLDRHARDLRIPTVDLCGMWIHEAGIASDARLLLDLYPGAVLLRLPEAQIPVLAPPLPPKHRYWVPRREPE